MAAIVGGHLGIVKLLVWQGAEVNAEDEQGKSALSLAESKKRKEIIRFLKREGAGR